MNVDSEIKARLSTLFKPLNVARASTLPPASSLSSELDDIITRNGTSTSATAKPIVVRLFATAAVDIWLRAVHSFLVSAALTETSPIWSSVSGYYSSYYSVRSIAHLLGYFHLYRRKCLVRMEIAAGTAGVCRFEPKKTKDHEHQLYWRLVKASPQFSGDVFFTDNSTGSDLSDVGHRNHANYADHLYPYPAFKALDEPRAKLRVQKISEIELDTPPIPNRKRFPDLEAVQVVAYHRLVRVRQLLDESLGQTSRFWSVHRDPSWSRTIMDFQLTEPRGTRAIPTSA